MDAPRDHGGGLDAAIATYGGTRQTWLDLSTGINPVAYPLAPFSDDCWTALPDQTAFDDLYSAARAFWNIPDGADIIAASGASALIAQMPWIWGQQNGNAQIATRTYNEHAAAFRSAGWDVNERQANPDIAVHVHPNNPDGQMLADFSLDGAPRVIIDESFCDTVPAQSHIAHANRPNTIILKSFGKFWGLAGMRLGFAIGEPALIAQLRDRLGPWAVTGPALQTGTRALKDIAWADKTRARLRDDADRLDKLTTARGAEVRGGTDLFRLYHVDDARDWQERLAKAHVWSRVFPYSDHWLRLGLPAPTRWDQLESAL